MKRLFPLIFLLGGAVFAAPYPQHDVKEEILHDQSIDFGAMSSIIRDLAVHAADYPVRFDNDADLQRAREDAALTAALIGKILQEGIVAEGHEAYLPLLQEYSRLSWIGHNLDLPGAAAAADESFAMLLLKSPAADKPAVSEQYGRFLASTGDSERALAFLQSAYRNGRQSSADALAMVLLMQDKKDEALEILRAYSQAHPDDAKIDALRKAVESGNIELKTADGP